MITYGMGILPLIRYFRASHHTFTQTWYDGGAGAGGTFAAILRHIENLIVRGPPRRYFLEPTKSILVLSPRNVPRAESFFPGYGLQVVKASRYLGEFVRTETAQDWLLEDKVKGWSAWVAIMSGVADKHSQTS